MIDFKELIKVPLSRNAVKFWCVYYVIAFSFLWWTIL